jgi:exodeoxyribonuclease-3
MLTDFQDYVVRLQRERPNLVLCGDYNICHEAIDIHDPVHNANSSGFLPEERDWMSRFLQQGRFTDTYRYLHPAEQAYTWWSFRANARANDKGWRLDYCMVSEPLKPHIQSATILPTAHHSDHCPAELILH